MTDLNGAKEVSKLLDTTRLATLVLVLAAGGSVTGNFAANYISPPRPDPHTGTDAKAMESRLEERFEARQAISYAQLQLELAKLEIRIGQQLDKLPPIETRRRIEAIEQWLREKDPTWSPPSYNWSGSVEN